LGNTVPLYYFVLKTGRKAIPDPEGQELADENAARVHAATVAQQLMQGCENGTRTSRIQVCDDYLRPLFDVYFADLDQTLKRYPLNVQVCVEESARMAAGFGDALDQMKATLRDVRKTLARAEHILTALPGPQLR